MPPQGGLFAFSLASSTRIGRLSPFLQETKVEIVDYEFTSWADKARECHRVIQSLPPSQMVLYLDGYDSFFVRTPQEILDLYKWKWDNQMVFGASVKCFPNPQHAPLYPRTDTPFKYLNAGLHMGPAGLCAQMFEVLFDYAGEEHFFDQEIWSKLFTMQSYPISLDHECHIFQNCHENPYDYLTNQNGKIYNTQTGSRPCIFHTPGMMAWNEVLDLLKGRIDFTGI